MKSFSKQKLKDRSQNNRGNFLFSLLLLLTSNLIHAAYMPSRQD